MVVVDVDYVFEFFGGPRGLRDTLLRHAPGQDLKYPAVQAWKQRKKIPAKWVGAVIYCAERQGRSWTEFLIDDEELTLDPRPTAPD